MELEDIEDRTTRASRHSGRLPTSFEVYIRSNAGMIPNYAEQRRYGERVSTGFVESAINTVVGKRFCKRQTDSVVERWGSSHAAGPDAHP